MALRKPSDSAATKTVAAPTPNPAFEGMDDDAVAVVERPTVAATAATAEAEAVAAVVTAATERAVALAPANTALAMALKKTTVLDDLQNVIDFEMLEGMSFGAFPRVVVDLGGFTNKTTSKELGRKIQIEILSWNFVTLVTAGEQNNKEADKLVRSSYDGINLLKGEGKVTGYVAELKTEGYSNASAKKYIELYAMLVWTEVDGDITPDEQKIHQISVSPQSTGPWGAFLLASRMRANKGVDTNQLVTLGSARKTLGNNTFGVIEFGVKR